MGSGGQNLHIGCCRKLIVQVGSHTHGHKWGVSHSSLIPWLYWSHFSQESCCHHSMYEDFGLFGFINLFGVINENLDFL